MYIFTNELLPTETFYFSPENRDNGLQILGVMILLSTFLQPECETPGAGYLEHSVIPYSQVWVAQTILRFPTDNLFL